VRILAVFGTYFGPRTNVFTAALRNEPTTLSVEYGGPAHYDIVGCPFFRIAGSKKQQEHACFQYFHLGPLLVCLFFKGRPFVLHAPSLWTNNGEFFRFVLWNEPFRFVLWKACPMGRSCIDRHLNSSFQNCDVLPMLFFFESLAINKPLGMKIARGSAPVLALERKKAARASADSFTSLKTHGPLDSDTLQVRK
jgi:hypothetical protein